MNQHTDFEKAIADANYEAVESHVGDEVRRFRKRYRWIHVNEVLSTAGNAYVDAVATFDKTKGDFQMWVSYKVNKALKTLLRTSAKEYRRCKSEDDERYPLDGYPVPEPEPRFWLDEWLATLPPDARKVAMMVFDTPFAVHVRISELGGFETPEAFRNGVREHLRTGGWSEERIEAAFLMIQRSL